MSRLWNCSRPGLMGALSNLIEWMASLPMAGLGSRVKDELEADDLKVPFNPNCSIILRKQN